MLVSTFQHIRGIGKKTELSLWFYQGKSDERISRNNDFVEKVLYDRELGILGSEVGKRLGLSQSAISRVVQRGEQLVSEHRLPLINDRNA